MSSSIGNRYRTRAAAILLLALSLLGQSLAVAVPQCPVTGPEHAKPPPTTAVAPATAVDHCGEAPVAEPPADDCCGPSGLCHPNVSLALLSTDPSPPNSATVATFPSHYARSAPATPAQEPFRPPICA